MRTELSIRKLRSDFVRKVEEVSGQSLLSCNQCGKCSAGCPMCFAMDRLPNQIIRLAQLGLEDDVAQSNTVWICASCLTCSVHCPRGVDLGRVMEAIRLVTLRKNLDYLEAARMPASAAADFPQIALVSVFRKHTA